MPNRDFNITKDLAGNRLDVALTMLIPETTRSQIQLAIKNERVLLNGKAVHKNVRVVEKDCVTFLVDKKPDVSGECLTIPVIAETDEYLVINKPSGMSAHAASHDRDPSVVDVLLQRYPALRNIGDDPQRPGIVHRLDKDASGVMVVAKTQESFDALKRQFKLRRVKKEYLIFVYGHVTPLEGEIHSYIARSKECYTRYAASATPGAGREAITRYLVEKTIDDFSLVHVWPQTGRTHQLRVHFYSRGYPIVGDRVYVAKRKHVIKSRLMLHAVSLGFKDLSGEQHVYEVLPGEDFETVVNGTHTV